MRFVHITTVLMVMACVYALSVTCGTAAERPNIIVVLIDDMGVMDTSVSFLTDAQGKLEKHPFNDLHRTPNMQRLADQGVRFSNFYAMSVCSPSRMSIMTGQTSARHHVTQWISPESNNAGPFGPKDWLWKGAASANGLLPEQLRKAGYRTIHCGKGHFGPFDSPAENPQHIGFDINIAGGAIGQPGSYYGKEQFGHDKKGRERRAVPGLEEYRGKDIFLTEALTLEINKAISQSVEDKKPFFAYMAHYAVHAPFQADDRFVKNYAGQSKSMAAFATLIEGMDKSLGDILDHVQKLGIAENTLVLFVGDNGSDAPAGPTHDIACAAPLRGKKGTHYEGGMRVPFIAAWAQPNAANQFQKQMPITAGTVVNDIGSVCDIYPTIIKVAGAEKPSVTFDGIDISLAFAGKDGILGEREFLMHFPHSHRSSYFTTYRKGNWKVIYHYHLNEKDKWSQYELYNLAVDRAEANNLAQSDPDNLKRMMAGMIQALENCGAQYPLNKDKTGPLKPVMP